MTKPVDEEELILRIKALLRRAKVASEQKLKFGELELDYTKMSATVSGKDVDLKVKSELKKGTQFSIIFKK
jgi:DNA-binding response OmpR family regulator